MISRTLPLVVCLLAACGKPVRQEFALSTDAPSRTQLVPLGDGALAANEGGRLMRLGPGGETRWRLDLQRELLAAPVVADQTVVAATAGGEWVGLAPDTGDVLWLQPDGPRQRLPLVAEGQRAFAQTTDGTVRAIHAPSGGTAWTVLPTGADAVGRLGPVVCGQVLVVTRGAARLEALALEDGASRWSAATGPLVGLTCDRGRVLVAEAAGTVRALSADAGELHFERSLGAALLGAPVAADGWFWVQSDARTLTGLREDGQGALRTLPLPIEPGAPVAAAPGLLVVVDASREGWVVGLELPSGNERFRHRVDSALRAPALLRGSEIWVQPRDGRVIGLRMRGR